MGKYILKIVISLVGLIASGLIVASIFGSNIENPIAQPIFIATSLSALLAIWAPVSSIKRRIVAAIIGISIALLLGWIAGFFPHHMRFGITTFAYDAVLVSMIAVLASLDRLKASKIKGQQFIDAVVLSLFFGFLGFAFLMPPFLHVRWALMAVPWAFAAITISTIAYVAFRSMTKTSLLRICLMVVLAVLTIPAAEDMFIVMSGNLYLMNKAGR